MVAIKCYIFQTTKIQPGYITWYGEDLQDSLQMPTQWTARWMVAVLSSSLNSFGHGTFLVHSQMLPISSIPTMYILASNDSSSSSGTERENKYSSGLRGIYSK